jgi:hypothetical protein
MALVFHHFPVIIRKHALLDRLASLSQNDPKVDVIKSLLKLSLQDDYLVGMDEMSCEDDSSLVFLTGLGLVWHDEEDCVDFYLGGPYEAPWLEYKAIPSNSSRVKGQPQTVWSAYKHVDDLSTPLIGDDGYDRPVGLSWG